MAFRYFELLMPVIYNIFYVIYKYINFVLNFLQTLCPNLKSKLRIWLTKSELQHINWDRRSNYYVGGILFFISNVFDTKKNVI